FDYASDMRGAAPFYPSAGGRIFSTLQIPTTLPTLDELIGREPRPNEALLSSLCDGLNVHTGHAEVEGRPYLSLFEEFLREVHKRSIETVLLRDVVAKKINLPARAVTRGSVPGRSGWVAKGE